MGGVRVWLGLILMLLASAPGGASAQSLLRRYVARQDARAGAHLARATERRAVQRMRARVAADDHPSERQVVRPLGRKLYAVYTRSQLHRGHHDRFRVFRVDRSGRAREVPLAEAYRAEARDASYEELVDLWRSTVHRVLTRGYAQRSEVRVQVDTELRFLEGEIAARAGDRALPWDEHPEPPLAQLDRVGQGRRLLRALRAAGRPGAGSIDMLQRGTYRVFDTHNMPRAEFRQLLRDGRASEPPFYRDVHTRDHAALARRRALARRLNADMHGYQFADQRSAMVQNEPANPESTASTIIHELNHGANRVPRRARFAPRHTLAFEHTAAVTEARAAGRRLGAAALRRIKQRVIDTYGLSASVDSIADRPHGHTDNWVPRFPRGQERRFTRAYFGVSRSE